MHLKKRGQQIFRVFISVSKEKQHGRQQEMRTSLMYLSGAVGEILQRAVRSDGEDSGHRLHLWACWMRRQNDLTLDSSFIKFASSSAERSEERRVGKECR